MNLVIGDKYKWKHEPQILTYIGKKRGWHQFTFNGAVWCEALDSDLHLMEGAESCTETGKRLEVE